MYLFIAEYEGIHCKNAMLIQLKIIFKIAALNFWLRLANYLE